MTPKAPHRRSKRRAPIPRPLVEWRDGVHLVGTPLWCDAVRSREVCFLSSARVPEARRHRQIIATDATIRLLAVRGSAQATLAVPYRRPFSLGVLRLELFPSGHAVGSASLAVDTPDGRVIYAGPVGRGGGMVPPAEVRPCDALVIDTTFGHPRFRFPPAAESEAAVLEWAGRGLAEGATPVLLADPLGRAPDLMRLLAPLAPLRAHPAIIDAARRLRALGVDLPVARRFAGTPPAGEIVLWPADRGRAPLTVRRARVALVSGLALDAATVSSLGVDAAFPWADRLGHDELLAYIEASGATDVYLLGAAHGLPGQTLGQLAFAY